MMKIKFEYSWESDKFSNIPSSKATRETDAVTLPEILEEFRLFLGGCGFNVDGQLEIVDYED